MIKSKCSVKCLSYIDSYDHKWFLEFTFKLCRTRPYLNCLQSLRSCRRRWKCLWRMLWESCPTQTINKCIIMNEIVFTGFADEIILSLMMKYFLQLHLDCRSDHCSRNLASVLFPDLSQLLLHKPVQDSVFLTNVVSHHRLKYQMIKYFHYLWWVAKLHLA